MTAAGDPATAAGRPGGDLSGAAVVVTGAGRGIGRAIALEFADVGARLLLVARTKDQLDAVADEVTERGGIAEVVAADVARSADADRVAAAASAAFGGVDVLVNNAGALVERRLADTTDDEWSEVVSTNLDGTFRCCRAVGRSMIAAGRGKVVNVASTFALRGVAGFAAYAASKGGVLALTRTLAVEWARYGIQVNAVAPGHVATDINAEALADEELGARVRKAIPARRIGEPKEVAAAVRFLASPEAAYISGHTVVVDGGATAR